MYVTPKYVFNSEEIVRCYNEFKNVMEHCEIYYALKANPEIGVAKVLNSVNSGFEVSSVGEFKRLLEINVPTEHIICGLPVKKIEMIEFLYEKGCRYFAFDDMRELEKLQKYAPDAKKILRVYISDIVPRCIEYGMPPEKIEHNNSEHRLLEAIDGISFHISFNTNIDNLLKALDRIETLLNKMDRSRHKILNIGGSYELGVPEEFYKTLNERLKRLKDQFNLTIMVEPGSAIINKAGKVMTKVILVKERGDFNDVYVDAGIPTGIMRKPGYIKLINREALYQKRKVYRFLDITSLHRPLFQFFLKYDLKEDDILELGECGAYTICYSNEFHSWDRPEVEIE